MRKIIPAVVALLACLGLALAAPASAGPKPAAQVSSNTMGTLAAGCPTGDGPASWGKAKVCPDGAGGLDARVHYQDSLTDGYCVRVRVFSNNSSSWIWYGDAACTTGQWVTFSFGSQSQLACNAGGARLYRVGAGGTNYFVIPNTYC